MSVRRNTKNRLNLIRTCYVCGRTFPTTADTPFIRQMYNVDGKRQKTCYFCSLSCKQSTYKHKFDGLEWQRRKQREANRDPVKRSEYNRRYYATHAEQEKERARQAYWSMTEEERLAASKFQHAKEKIK